MTGLLDDNFGIKLLEKSMDVPSAGTSRQVPGRKRALDLDDDDEVIEKDADISLATIPGNH